MVLQLSVIRQTFPLADHTMDRIGNVCGESVVPVVWEMISKIRICPFSDATATLLPSGLLTTLAIKLFISF